MYVIYKRHDSCMSYIGDMTQVCHISFLASHASAVHSAVTEDHESCLLRMTIYDIHESCL